MYKKQIPYAVTALLTITTLTGCSLFRGINTNVQSTAVSITAVEDEPQPSETSGGEKNLYGHWTVYEVNSQRTTGEERPYIIFDEASRRIYASNGCNTLNGDFLLSGEDGLRFDNVLTTARACADAPFEFLINQAVNNCAYYSIERRSREWYLTMYDESRFPLMVLRRHGLDYLNGAWRIVGVGDEEIDDESAQLLIDIDEHRLHGNNGCNILNGTILLDPDKENSIMFQQLMTTKMACPDKMRQGTDILVALEEAESCRRGKNGTATLFDKDGKRVMTLKNLDDK